MSINLKKALLAGTAIVAVSAFATQARAADTEMAAAAATPTNMLTGFTSGDDLNNIVDDANDFGTLDADNGVSAASINSDFTGGLAVYDGTNDTASGDTLTAGYFDIATATTFQLLFGGSLADGSGTDGLEEVTLAITGGLGDANATTQTRGGTLNILGTANNATGPGALTVGGNTLMTAVNLTAGAGGAANAGSAVSGSFGNASTDTFNVTGMAVTGGAGSGAANSVAGGAASATVTGAATVGASNLAVVGGAAGAGAGTGAAGGNASATFNNGLTLTGTTTVTGGADHNSAGGAGGDASLTVTGNVSSSSTLALSTGAEAAAGGGLSGDASATFGGNVTFTAITMNDNGDGDATLTFNGSSAQTVAGTIDGVGAAEGNIVVSNANGVTFTGKVGNTQGAALITVSTTGGNSAATFQDTLTATQINLGDGAGTGTNTLTLDSTDNDFTVTALIDGTAGDTDNVVVSGGGVVTFAAGTKIGNATAVQSLSIGADTQLIAGGTVYNVTAVTLASGSELNVTGAALLTGSINGNGTLDIDNDVTVAGSIGDSNDLTAIEIATGKVLTVSAAAADRTVDATTITLQGAASGLTLTPGANDIIVAEDVSTAVDGAGVLIVSDGAGTVTYQGDLGASTTFSLASLTTGAGTDQSITTNGNVFVDAVALDDDDTWNILGSTVTVSGTVNGVGDSDGNVVVGNGTSATTATFSGVIGGTGDVDLFKVSANSTANVSQNIDTKGANTVVAFDVDGDLNISAADNTVTIDAVDGAADIDGDVVVTGDNSVSIGANDAFTFDGTLDTSLTAASTLTLVADGDGLVAGATSETTINTLNQIVLTSDLGVGDGAGDIVNLNFGGVVGGFDPDATAVVLAAGDTVDIATGAFLNVGIAANSQEFDDGDTIRVIDSDEAVELNNVDTTYTALIAAGRVVLVNSGLVTITHDATGVVANDLDVTVAFADAVDVFEEGAIGVGAAQTLLDMTSAQTTDELEEARGNLLAAADADAAAEVGESLTGPVDGSSLIAAQTFTTQIAGITTTRLAAARTGAETGMSAGEMGNGTWWAEGFGTFGDQEERDGVDGFNLDTLGVAAGIESDSIANNSVLGLALSYANSDVESDNANSTDTEIDSFLVAAYGDYDLDQRTYLAGQVGYSWSGIETTRHNVGGIAGLTADGDTDAHQFNLRGELGRDYMSGSDVQVTPKLLADYTYFSADDYTETGAGGANLTVDPEDVNIFNVGLGVDAKWLAKHNDGSSLEPGVHAAVRYDLIGDDVETTNTFAGGGASFRADGFDSQRTTLDLGGDLTYHAATNWDLKAGYNYQWKQDYDSHSGVLRASYKF